MQDGFIVAVRVCPAGCLTVKAETAHKAELRGAIHPSGQNASARERLRCAPARWQVLTARFPQFGYGPVCLSCRRMAGQHTHRHSRPDASKLRRLRVRVCGVSRAIS
jgi:hypothetical protein